MGQGRLDRQDLHSSGTPRDGPEPRRPHHPALHAQGPFDGDLDRPQHRSAHRRGPCPRHPRREGDVARARGRRSGRGHDGPGLGAGHETRRGHRHQPRRPHLPRGHHRARARHSGGGGLRECDAVNPRKSSGHRVLRRGRYRLRVRRHARIRPAQHRARLSARDPGEDLDEHRQSRPRIRIRGVAEQGRRPRAARIHHQPHDRGASPGAARVRQAEPGAQGGHFPADRGISPIR